MHYSNNAINNILSDKCPEVLLLHYELTQTNIVARAPEDVAKILTNELIRFLQVIREKKTRIHQRACRLLDSSHSNVSNDVKYLEEIFRAPGTRREKRPIMHKKPIVDYDAVRITVDLSY